MNEQVVDRQEVEKNYHNKKTRDAASEIRSTEENSYEYFQEAIGTVAGLDVLDFGCGDGWMSMRLARQGARVYGIDISEELITKAKNVADATCLSQKVAFSVMAGEALSFHDNAFDLVIGSAVLHHTDLSLALKSIARVLKPSGRAVFIEPLNQNIILKLWRKITPWRRSPVEKALTEEDLKFINKIFPNSKFYFFTLLSIFTTGLLLLLPSNRIVLIFNDILQHFDKIILKRIPALGKYAAVVVMDLRKTNNEPTVSVFCENNDRMEG